MTVHHGGKVGKADKTLGAKYFSTSAQKDSAPENNAFVSETEQI